jgi:hypothetical protein
MRGRKKLLILGIIALFINGCKTDTVSESYDLFGYLVSSADYYKIMVGYVQDLFVNDPTEEELDQLEEWVLENTDVTFLASLRNASREKITDEILTITSTSRATINDFFEKVDSIGKYYMVSRYLSSYLIFIVDKI